MKYPDWIINSVCVLSLVSALLVPGIYKCRGDEMAMDESPPQGLAPSSVGRPFVIAKGPGPSELLGFNGPGRIVFGDSSYLAVWDMWSSGTCGVYGKRVYPTGGAMDTTAIMFSTTQTACYPNVAFNGSEYFIVWLETGRDAERVCGTRLSSDGAVLDTAGVVISESAFSSPPAVASDGKNYLVAWAELGGISAQRVSASGVSLDKNAIVISKGDDLYHNINIVYGSGDYLVTWNQATRESNSVNRAYFARVDTNGTSLDVPAKSISPQPGIQAEPNASFDDGHYFVVWQQWGPDGWRIAGARIGSAGELVDPYGIVVSTPSNDPQQHPYVARGDECYLVVWQQNKEILGMTLDFNESGVELNSSVFPIRTSGGYLRTQDWPSVASCEGSFLVVWQEEYQRRNRFLAGAKVGQ